MLGDIYHHGEKVRLYSGNRVNPKCDGEFFGPNLTQKVGSFGIILGWIQILIHLKPTTTSWGCWKHVFGIPGVRPMFLKAELHKESKNGFKTINYRPALTTFFSKNCFRSKKIIKKVGHFVGFWIFMAIYMDKLDQFWKI